ncbi:CACTA en-spm transposon protein [Cucumis melo var. makuwa]|uniref:CACTA en-spm transposon protein n=1 Tax=Cucumis melo var. makuwa TaxID=1194695 RepID=A0A5A7SL49_CUCMM|nr:CACTA en-spm transposon protein [Cucumis melo var. makuwa]
MSIKYTIKWDICTTPKDFRGLGITKVKDTNHAFLCKWLCRHHIESDSLWKRHYKKMGLSRHQKGRRHKERQKYPHNASGVVSRKRVFPMCQARVGQTASRIGQIKFKIHLIPNAMHSVSGTVSGIRGFPTHNLLMSVGNTLIPNAILQRPTVAFFVVNLLLFEMVSRGAIMSSSYPRNNFMETDAKFLEFENDLDNIVGGSLSMGDNTGDMRSLELHIAINGRISMTITLGAEKPIFLHVVRFSQAIGVFVEHQMLTTFKEFRADCHRHFKKYSDPEEARANPPNTLIGRHKDWHFLYDHYMSRAFQTKAALQYSSRSKSFLQRQYELAKRKGESIDRVELFRETHVRAGTFMSQAAEDAHNQMLELQSQPIPEGSQPLSEDEICDQVLGRQPGYSKGLDWRPKPKARRTMSASMQDRNHQVLASQVERMQKLTEDFTRAQQGPPNDP